MYHWETQTKFGVDDLVTLRSQSRTPELGRCMVWSVVEVHIIYSTAEHPGVLYGCRGTITMDGQQVATSAPIEFEQGELEAYVPPEATP